MEQMTYNSFPDFCRQNKNIPFRYWIYRRIFTPYEQDKKYADDSFYEDSYCKVAYINSCIDLGNGDYLIGFEDTEAFHDKEMKRSIEFCKLSEIRLEWYEHDQEWYSEEEEDGEVSDD